MDKTIAGEFDRLKCCVIIPTYNNMLTLLDVINDVKSYTSNIIVVNDGSTDDTEEILDKVDGIEKAGYDRLDIRPGRALRSAVARLQLA